MSSYGPYREERPLRPGPGNSVWLMLWLVLVVEALVGGLFLWNYWKQPTAASVGSYEPRAITARGDLADDEKSTIQVYEQASKSVVYVTRMARRGDALSLNVYEVPTGTGSGFVWDKAGNIVTNFHVIQGATGAQVTLADHTTLNATVVGFYPDQDLAVLHIDVPAGKLFPIPVGTSQDLQVGQKVLAIGNPFGLDQTLTTGVISALGREIEAVTGRPIKGVIQTDAAINPGNSGGPLLDSAGRLIGVNTAISSPNGAYAGIGFAIPVDEVNRLVPQLIAHGKVTRPNLGVVVATDRQAQQLRVKGVLILQVLPDSPAAKAGLQPTYRDALGRLQLGDVITAIDGKAIKSTNDLPETLGKHQVGDTIKLSLLRDDQPVEVQITLEAVS